MYFENHVSGTKSVDHLYIKPISKFTTLKILPRPNYFSLDQTWLSSRNRTVKARHREFFRGRGPPGGRPIGRW